jgi:uncharacterized repeat protein (TIGR03837 family)
MAIDKTWDIFCKIVDNFGDIGVCWRLAQQLHSEHQLTIRLYIDDLHVAKQLIPTIDTSLEQQSIQGISIIAWHADTKFPNAAPIVIESFACELPQAYLATMQPSTVWVNLEYLSAESWVDDFHANSSKRGTLTRHFFFPGFTSRTGGLLREHDLIKQHQELDKTPSQQQDFWQSLGLVASPHLKVSLFCYPHAPISDLLSAMAQSNQPINCYVPAGSILPSVADFFGCPTLHIGDTLTQQNLTLHVIPFLSQRDYDKLLSNCDINFVRGEDSWVRAIWASKPFIWQPYLQTEQTHIKKLHAFLDLFYAECADATKVAVLNMHNAWLAEQIPVATWQDYLDQLPALKSYSTQQTNTLAQQTDLATKLVIFSEKMIKNILKNKV